VSIIKQWEIMKKIIAIALLALPLGAAADHLGRD